MAQGLVTYGDIISSIREKLGIQPSDALATNKIKRIVNEYYLNEVIPFKNWMWLQKSFQAVHQPAYVTGHAAVTKGSATVTLSTAPTSKNFTNYIFSVADSDQIYLVSAHTTSSTTLTLSTAFQETTDATAVYKIWRDRIDLPTNARETVDITHIHQPMPLDGLGPQKFREKTAMEPKAEGFPVCYNTYDYFDPSTSGDDETESDRFRQTRIFPSINDQVCILNVDYIQETSAMEDLTDEPLLPLSDRIVIFYGAMAMAYSVLARDENMSDRYQARADRKLARMAGNREEGQDTPALTPSSSYVNNIRMSGLRRRSRGW